MASPAIVEPKQDEDGTRMLELINPDSKQFSFANFIAAAERLVT